MIALLALAAAAAPCDPPRELAAWRAPAVSGALVPGRRTRVALAPGTKFLKPPEKTPDETERGGMAPFRVMAAGRYRIALSERAWLDVLEPRGGAVKSAAHGHGTACAGIAKMVDFDLARGAYVLQLSGASAASAEVLIAPVAASPSHP